MLSPANVKVLKMEIALMGFFDYRKNIIVPNVSWGICPSLHECDLLILHPSGYATEVEIKTNKADIRRDKRKRHGHEHRYIRRLFFAVPEELRDYALPEIPEKAGLITVNKEGKCTIVRRAKPRKDAHRWTEEERIKLLHLGMMRLYDLKRGIKCLSESVEFLSKKLQEMNHERKFFPEDLGVKL
jgi:hypothetical protein